MSEAPLSMGVVHNVSAESFGEPGHRTFRLRASTGPGEISIWLEKEQIVALGGAIAQILGAGADRQRYGTPADLFGSRDLRRSFGARRFPFTQL